MYTKTIIPTIENHTIEIPEEFYGKEVIVEVKNKKETTDEMFRIRKVVGDNRINLKTHKFNREELNDHD